MTVRNRREKPTYRDLFYDETGGRFYLLGRTGWIPGGERVSIIALHPDRDGRPAYTLLRHETGLGWSSTEGLWSP